MLTVKTYNDFFRQCAVKHKDILHNVLGEQQDGAVGECKFFIGFEKAINGIRSQTATDNCTIIVLKYEVQGKDNGMLDYRAKYTGAFIVCKAAATDDTESVETAETTAEEVTWDIINMIIQKRIEFADGTHCNSPFGEMTLNDFKMSNVGPILDSRFGWLTEFEFLIEKRSLINKQRITTKFN